jgi:3-oxoacyl-[acyl-carrier protein] reductase
MRSIDLSGQRAVVTGASSGIGRATAYALAQAGADVAVHYRNDLAGADVTAETIRAMGRKAVVVRGDFVDHKQVTEAINAAIDGLGGDADILINGAGSFYRITSIEETEPEMWDQMIAANLSSVFHAVRAALPRLRPGARIVSISSAGAHHGGSGRGLAYVTAKGGIITLTRGLAKALGPRGIRVNAISPGIIHTPAQDRLTPPGGNTLERLETVRQTIPLGRIGLAEDCADAVLFLVSPLSSFILGEVIEVNGGQHFA